MFEKLGVKRGDFLGEQSPNFNVAFFLKRKLFQASVNTEENSKKSKKKKATDS